MRALINYLLSAAVSSIDKLYLISADVSIDKNYLLSADVNIDKLPAIDKLLAISSRHVH